MVTKNSANMNIVVGSANEITQPLQPIFLGYPTGSEANATGDGTQFIVGSSAGITEVIDVGSNYSGTTFTAPVTGLYLIAGYITLYNLGAGHSKGYAILTTSNLAYIADQHSPGAARSSDNKSCVTFAIIVDMDAADTFVLEVKVFNSTKTVGITSGNESAFSVGLLA